MPVNLPPAPARIPEFDPIAPYPELAALRADVLRGDWTRVSAFLTGLDDGSDRHKAVWIVAETPAAGPFLAGAAAEHGDDPLARTVLAAHHIHLAWEARGDTVAKYVTQEGAEGFHRHLHIAEDLLGALAAEHPEETSAGALRLTTARGLSLGTDEAMRRYRQLAEHDPQHRPGQTQLLQALLPKWGGSWKASFDFARECMAGARPGGLGAVLVADLHIERWLNVGGRTDSAHMRSPEVVAELTAAAEASVLHPDFASRYHLVEAHGHFAAAFGLGRQYRLAAPHFRAMNGYATESPWAYLRGLTALGEGTAYKRLRRRSLRHG